MSNLFRRIVFAVPVAAAGLMLGLALPSAGAGAPRTFPRPERELAQAQKLVDHALKLPAWLPAGAFLDRVSWIDAAPGDNRGVTSIDVWYRIASGKRLHVWQTSRAEIEKNPLGKGEALEIGGVTWFVQRAALGTVLTTRTPDGVTLQITAQLPNAVLERIAGSF